MRARTIAVAAVLTLGLVLGSAASAGSQPKKIDLTDPAAVNSYLQSIGVDPATVVRQVGLLNYAGPSCPGVGWNCTTSTKVVQVSSAGGQNKFDCRGQEPPNPGTNPATSTCVVLQSGPVNAAQCRLKDTREPAEEQHCTITQDGERNLAIVDQLIEQRTGPAQDATQTADVEQTATEKNQAQIRQDVKQSTKVDGTQDQNVHQVAIVNQAASGSDNFSHVHQNQDLSESGAAGIQNQNVGPLPTGVSDCDLEHKPDSDPNACASVSQSITDPAGGKNESHLHQNINERQTTTATLSTQTQENVDELNGIEAHVDQSNPAGVGRSLKITHQDARQRAEGGTTQVQTIDPNCCGVGTTLGGENNMDVFNQKAIQSASLGAAAEQRLGIVGDTNHVPTSSLFALRFATAAATSTDTCRITHDARNNEDSTNFTVNFNPCVGLVVVTTQCESSGAVGEGEGFCTPPPGEGDVTALSSSPTFGQAIAPPDFGEPSDFPGPVFTGI